MPTLTQTQIEAMKNQGLSMEKIEAIAMQRGYEMPKPSLLKRIGTGLIQSEKRFGESIAGAVGSTALSGVNKGIEEANQMNRSVQTNLINKIKEKRAKGEDVSRLINALKTLDSEVNFYDILNANTGGSLNKSARQIFGEAGGVVTDIAGFGALPGALGKTVKATSFLSGLKQGAVTGAKVGGLFGTATGATRAAQEDKTAGEIVGGGIRGGIEGAVAGGAVGGVLGGVSGAITGHAEKVANKELDYTLDLVSPRKTRKIVEQAGQEGRVTTPGLLKKATVAPSRKDYLLADSVGDIVSSKNSVPENIDAIRGRVSEINNGVKNFVAENKTPFNTNQLRSRLESGKDELKLIFASDKTTENTYNSVVDEFMNYVEKKDTLGLFEARQTFDQVPAIKKLLETERLGENAKREIVLSVRRAANEYVASLLPQNNPYKFFLQQETRMLEALGNMASKNVKTIGKNRLQMLSQEYPVLNWLVGGIAAGAIGGGGIAVGRSIFGSSD